MADTFEIVTQRRRVEPIPGGLFGRVVDVSFRTKPSGQVGMVTVPDTDEGIATVAELVRAKAALIEATQAL